MQYDFTLPPGGGQRLEVAGTFFKYTAGTGKIRITTNKNEYVDLVPGQGVRVGGGFSALNIVDKTGFANVGTVLAGDLDFSDDNVYGTVTVRDSSADLVQANKAFVLNGSLTAVGNGTDYKMVLLFNPAGSGRIVKVRGFRYYAQAGLPLQFLLKTGTYAPAAPFTAFSKLAGGARSLTQCGNETVLAAACNAMTALYVINPVLTQDKFELRDPIVLPPGTSLAFINGDPAATQATNWNIEFTEE